jgi:hypothetical protein
MEKVIYWIYNFIESNSGNFFPRTLNVVSTKRHEFFAAL